MPWSCGAAAVVTRLDLRLHPVGPELLCGFLAFPRERAAEVARAYRDFMADAPARGRRRAAAAAPAWAASARSCSASSAASRRARRRSRRCARWGRRWTRSRPTRTGRSSASGTRATRPACALTSATPTSRELPDEAIDTVIARANLPAASLSYVFLRPLGGALDVAGWACQCVGLWPPVPSLDPGQVAWVDGFVEAVEP